MAAPLDRTARIVTRLAWMLGAGSLVAGFLVAGVVALVASAWLVALALLASALAIGALIAWYRPRQPMVYGYAGKFRAEGKTVSAFVTSTANVVVLTVGDRNLAVSAADPDEFILAAGRLA